MELLKFREIHWNLCTIFSTEFVFNTWVVVLATVVAILTVVAIAK